MKKAYVSPFGKATGRCPWPVKELACTLYKMHTWEAASSDIELFQSLILASKVDLTDANKAHLLTWCHQLAHKNIPKLFEDPDLLQEMFLTEVEGAIRWIGKNPQKAFCGKCHCHQEYDQESGRCRACAKPIWEILARKHKNLK